MKQTNNAIIVDWGLYKANQDAREFVAEKQEHARLVLVVSDPARDDYEWDILPDYLTEIEWDAVIRNTGELSNVKFKQRVLEVLNDASNMTPVILLDRNHEVNEYYRDHGVLITYDDLDNRIFY